MDSAAPPGKEAGLPDDGPALPDGQPTSPDSAWDAAPPFSCTLATATPSLKPAAWRHPSAPRSGQTVTVSLQSRISPKPTKPAVLSTTLINRAGSRVINAYDVAGGKYWIYHIPVAGLAPGENCITVRKGKNVELALKIKAAPAGKGEARGAGVWKVVKNHQWRCDEQPTYGNFIKVKVLDEKGAAVKGARVRIR